MDLPIRIKSLLWGRVQIMWAEKIIESFNVDPKFWIDAINVVPVLRMKAGPCDYESEPLQLGSINVSISYYNYVKPKRNKSN
ncbi:hypothetical protein Lsha_0694 [Legionella shakespearei DSM 23087]|uniref:Uncharacterized protein n=1 Tax=Legionella shakespearei DSM 23087 TaxID=1122169 RepID=A0A0W0Z3C8_9GAMM|nr:hypothetical protein Lsha_0694 [Legionella shakespearei DSM 23087]